MTGIRRPPLSSGARGPIYPITPTPRALQMQAARPSDPVFRGIAVLRDPAQRKIPNHGLRHEPSYER